jgi:EAL domain-containing protein (putative c-di-GMP-specific phosphodiesterase class I)
VLPRPQWRAAHPESPLISSVNLAARQVRDPDLVTEIASILTEAGLPPQALQLELTESAAMGTAGEPLANLTRLAELGVRIAIDDFGTGYSNLAYLRHLPVHSLKLPGSFVAGLRAEAADPIDREILAALINLAHILGLTPEQAWRLRELGCDTAQGWHYAPAGAPEELSPLLDPTH